MDRHEPLEELHQLLQDNTIVAITDRTGKGGVGKTELAIQYSWYNLEDYPGGCCWLNLQGVDIVTQLSEFAFVNEFPGFNIPEKFSIASQLAYCWRNWQPGKVLLVFDNVTNIEQIQDYLPPMGSRFRVLITTRSSQLPYPSLPLGGLPETAALELLAKLLRQEFDQKELEFAKTLCQKVGCIPLGLYTIAAQPSDLQDKQSQEGDSGTDVVLELNWDALESSAQTMAALLSLFALAPIPWSLVSEAARAASLDFDLVVNRDILVQKYLLQKLDENTYQLHERIREFLSIKGEQLADIETLKQGFCSAIVAIAKDIPKTPIQSDILAITPAIPHLVEVATNQKDYLNDEDLIWPFVGLTSFYKGQGAYKQALPWCEQCLSTLRERLGEEHPAVVSSLNNLAVLYKSQGRYQEAEPLYLQALELRKLLLGEEHRDVATSLHNLAALYKSQGRYQEAEPLYLQALELSQRLLGIEHRDVAQSLNNLAVLYKSQGRYQEAEPLYLQALELRKRLLGEQHRDVAESLNNLAVLYKSQGRYQEAEPLYQQSLDLRQRLLGEEHPAVATSLHNLAALYYSQGRYSEAEPLYQQALDLRTRFLGQQHPDVAQSLNNLAALYKSQGRYQEAEPLYQQALDLRKRLLGQQHPDVATSLDNLAVLYDSQGRYLKAEPLFQQALDLRKRLLGKQHPDVATSLNNLAGLYESQGRYKEAKTLYQQARQIALKQLGEEHPTTRSICRNLEDLLGKSNLANLWLKLRKILRF
ncbi:MAG: tetratricopeptide repeat protein [Moorea sp. SIO4A3]|nr:tetratricopeptide repeat protein [Moorena sp. SIO4A3]